MKFQKSVAIAVAISTAFIGTTAFAGKDTLPNGPLGPLVSPIAIAGAAAPSHAAAAGHGAGVGANYSANYLASLTADEGQSDTVASFLHSINGDTQ